MLATQLEVARVTTRKVSGICVMLALVSACGGAERNLAEQNSSQNVGLQRANIAESAVLYRLSARGVFEPTQTAGAAGVAGTQTIERFAAGTLSDTEWVHVQPFGDMEPWFVLGADVTDIEPNQSQANALLRVQALFSCPRYQPQAGRLVQIGTSRGAARVYRVANGNSFALVREETGALNVISDLCVQSGSLELSNELEHMARQMADAQTLVLFLDYDGTLAPIMPLPQQAAPDADLKYLLNQLADLSTSDASNLQVHVVSGRGKKDLGAWLGHLPFSLHAEHGLVSSAVTTPSNERSWRFVNGVPIDTVAEVQAERDQYIRPLMLTAIGDPALWLDGHPPKYQGFDALLVEEKEVSLVLHYRAAELVLGRDLEDWADGWAQQFEQTIEDNGLQLEVTGGANEKNREVQIKPGTITFKVDKGNIINGLAGEQPPSVGTVYFAAGDSSTDENMFEALDNQAAAHEGLTTLSVHVGQLAPDKTTFAPTIVNSPKEVRALLERVIYLRRHRDSQ